MWHILLNTWRKPGDAVLETFRDKITSIPGNIWSTKFRPVDKKTWILIEPKFPADLMYSQDEIIIGESSKAGRITVVSKAMPLELVDIVDQCATLESVLLRYYFMD